MKRFNRWKTFQLIAYIVLALIALIQLFANKTLYHWVANEPPVRLLCIILWCILVISVIGIFFDFSFSARSKKDYSELDSAIYSDPISGLSNRNSCDVYIERYRNQPLPDHFCCIMFDLVNLGLINETKGHNEGNELIRSFANILSTACKNYEHEFFIGRNSGNQFLSFFQDAETEEIMKILDEIVIDVQEHNKLDPAHAIQFRYGVARNISDEYTAIGELITKAMSRVN